MEDTVRVVAEEQADEVDAKALEHLASSAGGWHRIQLAVLGFIGFCGIFWDGGGSGPSLIWWLAGALVVLAFGLSVFAIYLVGRVAYPFYGPTRAHELAGEPPIERRTQRLRRGIRITYLAVLLLVAATLTSWVPALSDEEEMAGTVVVDVSGRSWCGDLDEGAVGEVRLQTAEGPVTVPLDRVAVLRPVTAC